MNFLQLQKNVANGKYTFHHGAMHRGYLAGTNTKKGFTPIVKAYNGCFGKGYTVSFSDWTISSQYHIVNYYIERS